MVTADREVSEMLARDPRVDKIAFTGSTAVGRRLASLMGERIGRYSLELGGKSAAVILDDADIAQAASVLARSEILLTGQVCTSPTRIVVGRDRQQEMLDALAEKFAAMRVGDPFDPQTGMGPLATSRQRDRVESMIAKGVEEGADLVTGGGRPKQHFPNDQIALIPIRDITPVPLGLIWCTLHENARIRVLAKVARRFNPDQAHRTRPGIKTTPC